MAVALAEVAALLQQSLTSKLQEGIDGRWVAREKERRVVLSLLQDGSARLELFTGQETIPRRESWGSDEAEACKEALALLLGELPPKHSFA